MLGTNVPYCLSIALSGFDLEVIFSPLLEQWERAGLIKRSGDGWIELTVAGEFWNVNLAQFLIDYFQHYYQEDAQPGSMAL